ncbi:hypothetical protein WT83_04970 [Burkholderia territorii]|uniref:Nuclear transport factor 2 family protein n=1 Tax=Burkholderia territorii TaxID=1503055 RepID=A0A108F2X0_9BURK|nr:nuclear transport factor 2 family protein [Burkholderia territorii]KWN22025.1 hypothetical protein WT83_04970 [Burkholderia territorii]
MNDRVLIEQAIAHYAEGGTAGDPQRVALAFDPSASMQFIKEGGLQTVPIARFFTDFIKPGVMQQRTVRIETIDITGSAASAKVVIDYATHRFTDYFNLLKIDGKWLIVSKIFHRSELAPQTKSYV